MKHSEAVALGKSTDLPREDDALTSTLAPLSLCALPGAPKKSPPAKKPAGIGWISLKTG